MRVVPLTVQTLEKLAEYLTAPPPDPPVDESVKVAGVLAEYVMLVLLGTTKRVA